MEPEAHAVLNQLRTAMHQLKRSHSQVILLNNKLESAKTRCSREKSVKRISFRNTNQLKLDNLETLSNLITAYGRSKLEQVESLQAKLHELTGGRPAEFIMANSKKESKTN